MTAALLPSWMTIHIKPEGPVTDSNFSGALSDYLSLLQAHFNVLSVIQKDDLCDDTLNDLALSLDHLTKDLRALQGRWWDDKHRGSRNTVSRI